MENEYENQKKSSDTKIMKMSIAIRADDPER